MNAALGLTTEPTAAQSCAVLLLKNALFESEMRSRRTGVEDLSAPIDEGVGACSERRGTAVGAVNGGRRTERPCIFGEKNYRIAFTLGVRLPPVRSSFEEGAARVKKYR